MHTKLLTPKTPKSPGSNGFVYCPNHKNKPAFHTAPLSPPDGNHHLAQAKARSLYKETIAPVRPDNVLMELASSLNIREIMGTLYLECSRLVDTSNFALAIYDDQTDILAIPLILHQGQRGKPFSVRRSHIRGLISDALAQGTPFLIPDLFQLDPPAQHDPIRPARPIRSWLSIPICNPLHQQENPYGIIIVWSDKPDVFTKQQAHQLSHLGPSAAIAIRSIQLRQTCQNQALELAVINEIVQTLASTLQLDEVLRRIMELVETMLKVKAGALLLIDPTTQELVSQIVLGETARTRPVRQFRLSKGEGIAGYVALVGKKPELIARVDPDKRHYIKLAPHLQVEPRNCLYVPLTLKEQVIGVLAVMNKTKGAFTQSDVNLLDSIASYAAIAIDNARLYESVMAERDRALAIEEEVRKQLARDLHDGPTQLVSGIKMRIDHCQMALKKDPSLLTAEFIEMEKMCQQAIHQMRTMLIELLPLELEQNGQGLAAALRGFLERRQKEIKATKLILKLISYHPDNLITRQELQVEKTIFTIIQETVNNAIKHAQAGRIVVHLEETSNMIRTVIADNGKGFDVAQIMENYSEKGSLGMFNIQERAEAIGGHLTIHSMPGQGTQIILKVPKSKVERFRSRGTTGQLSLSSNALPIG